MSDPTFVFKIRKKSDGTFSGGGSRPWFSNLGRTWSKLAHVKSHLRQYYKRNEGLDYKDCEVVTYQLVEKELGGIDVPEFYEEMNKK